MQTKRFPQAFLPKVRVVIYLIDLCPFVKCFHTNWESKKRDFLQLGPKSHKNKVRIGIDIKIEQMEVE